VVDSFCFPYRTSLASDCSREAHPRFSEGLQRAFPALSDDRGQACPFPKGVGHVPREDLECVGAVVADLLGRADQVRERDLTLPDDVTIFQGPGATPVADVHDQDAIAAGPYLIGDGRVLPDVPVVDLR
jgi:hypothetical protein